MARVTIEDCLKHVPNRFELVHQAAKRARELSCGASTELDTSDKTTVIALRELAEKELIEEESNTEL